MDILIIENDLLDQTHKPNQVRIVTTDGGKRFTQLSLSIRASTVFDRVCVMHERKEFQSIPQVNHEVTYGRSDATLTGNCQAFLTKAYLRYRRQQV
jgi:hypothetical protein